MNTPNQSTSPESFDPSELKHTYESMQVIEVMHGFIRQEIAPRLERAKNALPTKEQLLLMNERELNKLARDLNGYRTAIIDYFEDIYAPIFAELPKEDTAVADKIIRAHLDTETLELMRTTAFNANALSNAMGGMLDLKIPDVDIEQAAKERFLKGFSN